MILLELTDGTMTLDLAWMLTDYIPKPPEVSETGELAPDAVIEDTLKLFIRAGSMEVAIDTQRLIDRLFQQARVYQRSRAGARLYLRCKLEDASGIYRAHVVDGHTEALASPLDSAVQRSRSLEVSVWVKHKLWEADSETELPLVNGSIGAKQTGGVTIYNHDDGVGGHDDWVTIAGVDVSGVVPAAVRLEITDGYASDQTFTLYLAHSAYLDLPNFLHVLEAESGTPGTNVTGTSTADANCSAGNYMALVWPASSEITLLRWALTATQIQACAGRWFRILARFKSLPPANLSTRLAVSLPSALPLLAVGGERVLSNADALQDLGALRIPPWLVGESSCGALDFKLLATKGSGVTTTYTGWTKLPGYTNIYYVTYTPATCVAVYNGTTKLTEYGTLALVDANPNSYAADLTGDGLYVNIGGTAPTSIEVWTVSIDLDYLALLPADSLRCLRAAGSTGAVNTDKIVEDGMLGLSYIQAAGGTKSAQLSSYGSMILLVPGRDQRIYVLAANQSGGSEIARTHSLRAYYRPRRLTL